jgi:hypothetical protein
VGGMQAHLHFQHVIYCGWLEKFIHCLNWSWNEVQHLISHFKGIESCPF